MTVVEGAVVSGNENYLLFLMADEKSCTVAKLLLGYDIPLQNMELELYKTYRLVTERLHQQQAKHGNS